MDISNYTVALTKIIKIKKEIEKKMKKFFEFKLKNLNVQEAWNFKKLKIYKVNVVKAKREWKSALWNKGITLALPIDIHKYRQAQTLME